MTSMNWLPSSESELRNAMEQGLLRESHHLDLKRMAPPGKAANRETAKDLASMAVDGGALIYGVDEANGTLTPFNLEGFRERMDQIGRSLVDEPLRVRIEEFPSEADPALGYAVVIVPESPSAPHMVDGRYRGRGDTTNIQLSDAEVLRLHTQRQQDTASVEELLRAEIERDPTPEHMRQQAHLFVVAEPVTGRSEMFLETLEEEEATRWISTHLINGSPGAHLSEDWSPDLGLINRVGRETEGWVATSGYMAPGRVPRPEAHEDDLLHIEFRENGGVRLFCGRASDTHPSDSSQRVAFETIIGGLTLRVVLMAEVLSEACKHLGSWRFGLAVTNLRGTVSWSMAHRSLTAPPFSSDDYLATTTATREEIEQDSLAVADRLFSRLNRGLNGGSVTPPRPIS